MPETDNLFGFILLVKTKNCAGGIMRKLEVVRGKSRRFVEFDTLDELILWLINNKISTTAKTMWHFPNLKGWFLFEDTYIRRVNQKR